MNEAEPSALVVDPLTQHVRRRRIRRAWLVVGFVAIAVVGSMWAGLTKDPIRNRGLIPEFGEFPVEDEIFFEDGPGFFPAPFNAPVLAPPVEVFEG